MYLRMDNVSDSFLLLQVIANDCYKTGAFYFSLKAFDVLERLDPTPQYWDGKKGAAIGVFQLVIAEKENFERLQEAYHMLRSSDNPQVCQWRCRHNTHMGGVTSMSMSTCDKPHCPCFLLTFVFCRRRCLCVSWASGPRVSVATSCNVKHCRRACAGKGKEAKVDRQTDGCGAEDGSHRPAEAA